MRERSDSFLTKQGERGGRFERFPNFFSFCFLRETGSEVSALEKVKGRPQGL